MTRRGYKQTKEHRENAINSRRANLIDGKFLNKRNTKILLRVRKEFDEVMAKKNRPQFYEKGGV